MTGIREGYKQTVIGIIPEEWEVKKINDTAEVFASNVDKKSYDFETPVYLCNYMDVYSNDYITNNIEFMQATATENEINKFTLKVNDVIITKDSETPEDIAASSVVMDELENVICGYHLTILRPNKGTNGIFLSKQISLDKIRMQFSKFANGSTRFGLSSNVYEKIRIPIPPLVEQQKIADILSCVDDNISEVDSLIEKIRELKNGLMQQLLTKGIGHTKFKQTELGEIPECWEVKKLGELCQVKGGKRLPKGYELQDDNNGYPYIRVSDMSMGGIDLSKIKFVPVDVVNVIKNYKITTDDIFISVAGTLGIVGKVPFELNNANLTENADKLCNLKCDKTFLMYYLQSNAIQSIIKNESTKSAQPKLAINRIPDFDIFVPALKEQQQIADILSSVDIQIVEYQTKKEKLTTLKKGLMEKLLTGEIRVNV